MKQSFFIFTIVVLSILFLSCEKPDEEAPTVTILTLQENDVVYEIVVISCVATDNEAVKKVELWLDGEYSGISDNTEPFKLVWDTTNLENRTYVVTARAYDVNGNKSDSDPINIIVNNTLSIPVAVDVTSVSYDLTHMTIKWDKSSELDFESYTIIQSDSEYGVGTEIATIIDINITEYSFDNFDPTQKNWFRIKVTDTFGYSSLGAGLPNSIDLPPTASILNEVFYNKESYWVTWSENNDNDFESYVLLEADNWNMSNSTEIFKTEDRTLINFVVNNVASDYRYYQVIVEDLWGLKTSSEVKEGIPFITFQKSFGGSEYDVCNSVQQTEDGGYIAVGTTASFSSSWDIWLIKTDEFANEEWNKVFGGSNKDMGWDIKQTTDGGFIIYGLTESFESGHLIWLIKTDSDGNEEWNRTFEGSPGYSIFQTADGGYIFTGQTVTQSLLLIKANSNGEIIWEKNYDTNKYGNYAIQADDGGYVITGYTSNSGYNKIIFLLKTDSNGNEEWNKQYTENSYEGGRMVINTNDGGYIIAGSDPNDALWGQNYRFIRTDLDGNEEWNRFYGGNGDDFLKSIHLSTDGYVLITGITYSDYTGKNNSDVQLIIIGTDGFPITSVFVDGGLNDG